MLKYGVDHTILYYHNNQMETYMANALKITIALACASSLIYAMGAGDRDKLAKVKSGEYDLVCGINSGDRDQRINPKLVTGFSSDIGSGTWMFVNGYASNCELKARTKPDFFSSHSTGVIYE